MTHRRITPGSSCVWIDLLGMLVQSIWGSVERGQCGMSDYLTVIHPQKPMITTQKIFDIFTCIYEVHTVDLD